MHEKDNDSKLPPLPPLPNAKVTIRKTLIGEDGKTYEVETEVDIPYVDKSKPE